MAVLTMVLGWQRVCVCVCVGRGGGGEEGSSAWLTKRAAAAVVQFERGDVQFMQRVGLTV